MPGVVLLSLPNGERRETRQEGLTDHGKDIDLENFTLKVTIKKF